MESSSQNESADPKDEGSSTDDQRQKSILSFFKPLARKEKLQTNNIEIDKPRVKEVKSISIEEAGNSFSESNLKRSKKKKSKRKEKDTGEAGDDVANQDLKEEARNKEQKIETISGTKKQEHAEECPKTCEKEEERRTKKKRGNKQVPDPEGNSCVGEFERNTEIEERNDPIKVGSDADEVASKQVKRKKRKEEESERTHDVKENDDEDCNVVRNRCKASSSAKGDGNTVEGHSFEVRKEHADKKGSKSFPKKMNQVCPDIVDNSEKDVLEGKEEHDGDFEVFEVKVKRKKLKKRVKNNLDFEEGFVKPIEKKKLIEKSSSEIFCNDGGESECLTKKVTDKRKSKKMKRNDLDSDEEKLDSDEVKQICEEKGYKTVASDVENEASNDVYIDGEDEEFVAKRVMRKKLKKIRKECLESEEEILIPKEEKPIHEERGGKCVAGDTEMRESDDVHRHGENEDFVAKRDTRKKLKKRRKKDLESEEALLIPDEEKLIHGKKGEIGFADNDEQGGIVRRKSKQKKKKKKHRFDSDDGDTSLCDDQERERREKSNAEIEGSHSDALIEELHEKNAESPVRLRPNDQINDNEEVEDLIVEDEISDDAENQCLTREKKAGIGDEVLKSKRDRKKTLERKGESSIVIYEGLAEGKATRRSTRNRKKGVKYDFDEEFFDTESEVSIEKSKKSKIMNFEDDDSDFETIEDCKARMKGNRKRKESDVGSKRGMEKQGRREKDESSEITEKGKKTKGTVQSPSKCQTENTVQIGKGEADKTIKNCLESQQSKSNFLAKFSKHQIEKQDEVILLEVETALPVVSHVMQQSDSEILWYKNLLVSVSLRKFTIIKERKDCMVVPSNVSLKSLINLDLDKKRTTLPKNITFRSLDHCIQQMIQRNSKFSVIDTLQMYLECQMKILKQCVAKAELPKSNIKRIWEKQEKIERIEIASERKHLPEKILPPPNPKADIRNLFGRAKSKKKVESISTEGESENERSSLKEPAVNSELKGSLHEKDGCEDSKRNKERKRKSKNKKCKNKKVDQTSEEQKNMDHDSSIELITKDREKMDCKKAGTIEDSFTKVSNRARKVEKDVVAQDEFVFSNDDVDKGAFEDDRKKRRSKKRARKLEEGLGEAEKVGVDTNKMVSMKGAKRKRKKGKGRSKSVEEDITVEIVDDEMQGENPKKKRGRPKKKSKNKTEQRIDHEQIEAGHDIEGKVAVDIEADVEMKAGTGKEAGFEKETKQKQVQDDDSGKKKRRKRRSKDKKDEGACEAGTEKEGVEETEKKPQLQSFDIRTLFGKSSSKGIKRGFEAGMKDRASCNDRIVAGKATAESTGAEVIDILGHPESSVKNTGDKGKQDNENDMEIVETESQTGDDVITIATSKETIAEEKPKAPDIRTLFRRSFEKAAKADDSVVTDKESTGVDVVEVAIDRGARTTESSVVICSQETVAEIEQSQGSKDIEEELSTGATETISMKPKGALKDTGIVISSQESTYVTGREQSKGSKASSEDRSEDIAESMECRKEKRRLKDKQKRKQSRGRTSSIKAAASSSADDAVSYEKEGTPSELKANREAQVGKSEVVESSVTNVEESLKVVSRTSSILSFFKPAKGKSKIEETVEIKKTEVKPEKSEIASDTQDSVRTKSGSSSSTVAEPMHVMVPDDGDTENRLKDSLVEDDPQEHDIDVEHCQGLKTLGDDNESMKLRVKRKRSCSSSIESIIDDKTPLVICKDILTECPALSFPGTENKRVKMEFEDMGEICEKEGACAAQKLGESSVTQKDILDLVECTSATGRQNLGKEGSKASEKESKVSGKERKDLLNFFQPSHATTRIKNEKISEEDATTISSKVAENVETAKHTEDVDKEVAFEKAKLAKNNNKIALEDETERLEDKKALLECVSKSIMEEADSMCGDKGVVHSKDCLSNEEMLNEEKLCENTDLGKLIEGQGTTKENVVENVISEERNDLKAEKGNCDISSDHEAKEEHMKETKEVESENMVKTKRPKRKRVPSIAVELRNGGEDDGRRRSSRVRDKEDQKREEEKRLREELEKRKLDIEKDVLNEVVEDETCESRSPEFKRRRKRKKISESSNIEETGDMNCSVEIIEDTIVNGKVDSGKAHQNGDSGDNEESVSPDGETKAEGISEIDKNVWEEKKSKLEFEHQPITEEFVNSTLLWTEKYSPIKHDHVIGNKFEVERVFHWLSSWKEKHESFVMKMKMIASKRSRDKDGSDSDFDDSSDEDDSLSNTFVIVGYTGCGSTATVYACAQELGYKVLEMNPSSCRSGKQIQSLLGEATQSHQVKRKFHGATAEDVAKNEEAAKGSKSLMSLFAGKKINANEEGTVANAKDGSEDTCEGQTGEKEASKCPVGGDMSLILFEQADIVFDEQDKGFWFGLNELRKQAKRPIIITTNEPSVAAKLEGGAFEMTKMDFVRPELITSHLQALCLAEQVFPSTELITKVVSYCRGNIRQSILQLQFILEQWKDPSYKLMKPKLESAKPEETEREDMTNEQLVGQGDDKVQEDKTDEVKNVEIRPMKVGTLDEIELTDSIQTCKAQKDATEEGESCAKDVSVEGKSKILSDKEKESKDGKISESIIANVNVMGSSAVDSLPDEVTKSVVESERKEEIDLHITVLEDEECGIIEEERSSIIEMKKVNAGRLLPNCHTNLYTPIKTRKCKRIDIAKDANNSLKEIAAIAEQISKINTRNDPTKDFVDEKAQRFGWWNARLQDGIIDEECLYPINERSSVLHEWYTYTSEAYECLKKSVIADETRDTDASSIRRSANSDVAAMYSSLEDCLPLSARLDHRSFCADTMPTISMICKSEESRKLNEYGRRSRRFLHYLDSISLHVEPELRTQLTENSIK